MTEKQPVYSDHAKQKLSKHQDVFLWLRKNLFSSWGNAIATFLSITILIYTIPPFLKWAVFDATFSGSSLMACEGKGACWVFIKENFTYFMVGFYPISEMWRILFCLLVFCLLLIPLFIKSFSFKWQLGCFLIFGFPVFAGLFLHGGWIGLPIVETVKWGGFLLTIVVAVSGIVLASPLAILLALGRQSKLPVVKAASIIFIEFWRGMPLVLVLFTASVMLPFFIEEQFAFNKLLRAIIALMFFEAAYLAEVLRGGLQAIPKQQYEAARVLGLGYWRTQFYVILPQAIRIVVPGIMNIWIALFKDTTLVLIIGLFDLLGAVHSVSNHPKWLGATLEGYVFLGIFYWVICFLMSRYSQKFELKEHSR